MPHALGLGWLWALSALDPGGEAGLAETWRREEGQSKKNPERKNGAGVPRTKDARLGLPEGVSARDGARRGPGEKSQGWSCRKSSLPGLPQQLPSASPPSFPHPRRRAAGVSSPGAAPALHLLLLACGQPCCPALQCFMFNGSVKAVGGRGAGVFPFYRWENQSSQEVCQSHAQIYQRR